MNWVHLLAICTATSLAHGCSESAKSGPDSSATVGAGPIALLDLNDQSIDFWQRSKDRITVVVFTRTDCPISNRHAPDVRDLYEKFHSRGVEFLLIYVDPSESPDAIRKHLAEYSYPCAGLRDLKHALVASTGATVTPEAVVFDRSRKIIYRGRINDRNVGFGDARAQVTSNDLANALEATIQGITVAVPVTKAVGCFIADLQ
ncbi:MAG: redoxin family protein [Planctomycetota bacterium]